MATQPDWAKAEAIVKSLTKGQATPGSGSGHLKGDVVNQWGAEPFVIEVKQTRASHLNVQQAWLYRLRKHGLRTGAASTIIAVFFGLRGYTYWLAGDTTPNPWSSLKIKEDCLPPAIIDTDGFIWTLRPLQSLRELAQTSQ